MGKENEQIQQQKQKKKTGIEVNKPTYEEVQSPAWARVDASQHTATVKTAKGVVYSRYDKMDIRDLCEELKNDKGSRSESFTNMYNAVDDLIKLAKTGGRKKDEVSGQELTVDFFETFYTARLHVNHYVYTHEGFHWTGKGERRLQISKRISSILKSLNDEIENYKKSLPEDKARMLEYRQERLSEEEIEKREEAHRVKVAADEMMRIASTGVYGPKLNAKEAKAASEKWLVKGYSLQIRELISGKSMDELMDKDDFIAYLEDHNNRMLANRITISLLTDKAKEITSDTPWLKKDLMMYVTDKLGAKMFDLHPEELTGEAQALIDEYKEANKGLIDRTADRLKSFSDMLHVSLTAEHLFEYPEMKLLIDESDDDDFKARLESLKSRVKETDKEIKERMKTEFSSATRDKITRKLVRNLGTMRVFGGRDQIMDQVDRFLGMISYIAPLEYHIENVINNTLKELKIDLSHRDHFVETISGGDPKEFFDKYLNSKELIVRYGENAKANNKQFQKKVDSDSCMLTQDQWDELEGLNVKSGAYTKDEFRMEMELITIDSAEGDKISRREYLSRRKFKDAQKKPARIRRVKAEQKLIKSMEGTFEARFMVHLSGVRSIDTYAPYRRLDSIYKGQEKQQKAFEAEEKANLEARSKELKSMLRTHGLSVPEMKPVVERFSGLMMDLLEIREDMNDDVKIRNRRMNLERFGAGDWEEALLRIESYAEIFKSDKEPEEITHAREKYAACRDKVERFKDGKYSLLLDLILDIPDMYAVMMSDDEKDVDAYLKNVLEPKLGAFAESVRANKDMIPGAVYMQYAYSYLDEIYSGHIKGDKAFYDKQLDDYTQKVFKVKPDGLNSAADNISAAEKAVIKELEKKGIRGEAAKGVAIGVVAQLYLLANTTEDFEKLFDKKGLISYAKSLIPQVKANMDTASERNKASTGFKLHETGRGTTATERDKVDRIAAEKKQGIQARNVFLGLDTVTLDRIGIGKSMVRIKAKGAQSVSLDKAKADKMRGLIKEYCGEMELPPVLIDALIEQGASQSVKERVTGTRWRSSLLYKHAFAMSKMYDFLRQDRKDDPAMTPEEAQMYIVKCYGDAASRRKLFETAKGPDVGALRQSDDYKKFRADYKKLEEFESLEAIEPSVSREQLDIARYMRTALITGLGIKGKTFAEAAVCARKYIESSSNIIVQIRRTVEGYYEGRKMSELYIDRQVDALREYFMKSLVGELADGKEYDPDKWGKDITKFYESKLNRDHVEFTRDVISNKELAQAEQKRAGSKVSERDIAAVINAGTFVFKGRVNKYEKLDEEQKKLFAIGLMMMDKGAIGLGAQGTAVLCAPRVKGGDTSEDITEAIKKYVAGGELNVKVNYRTALYKLINYGKSNILDPEGYTFSVTAYEKAMQFAQAVSANRNRAIGQDLKQMAGGYASINAAYVYYDKKQQQQVDALRTHTLTVDDVRKQLLKYAKNDTPSKQALSKNIIAAAFPLNIISARKADKMTAKFVRMNNIQKRLKKLSESDLKVFIRLMQERTVLDKSMIDPGTGDKPYIDQEKRTALTQALSADTKIRAEVLEGFDDNESCRQALVTALSFKLRDDMRLQGKTLNKDCFDKESFDRDTLVDWTIVENALDLIDEIAEKKLASYAVSHAVDYIAFSGNQEACDAYLKLKKDHKDPKTFKQDSFEKLVKQHADKDGKEDISRALAGYHALTDKEKNLFFRVLARRDLLDISRKNYMKNYFGRAERDFVNKAERDALIDEYIDTSLEGNLGIQLDDDAYFKAMASLFSTQISDRTEFSKTKDLTKVFANERNFVMGRATAIDWKLFKRALQFVNRASEELEFVEGNAQLYRAAGSLSKNGFIKVNYGFLRKNIHRTGNHWGRYLTKVFGGAAKDILGTVPIVGDVKLDAILDAIPTVINTADKVSEKLFDSKGLTRKGIQWLKKQTAEAQEWGKAITTSSSAHNIGTFGVADKELTEEEKAKKDAEKAKAEADEKKRREELEFYGHMQDGINNIIAQSKSAKQAFDEVAGYVKTNLVEGSQKLRWLKPVDAVEATQDEKNIVVAQTKGAKKDTTYSDVRDYGVKAKKVVNTAGNVADAAVDIMKIVPGGEFVIQLAQESTRKIALRFLNDAVIHNEIDLSGKLDENGNMVYPDELALLQKNAENFAGDMIRSVLTGVIGEEGVNDLLKAEEYIYSIRETVSSTMTSVMSGISYVKKCTDHVRNIAVCAENIYNVKTGSKNAKGMREDDDKKLQKAASTRLSPAQKEIVDKIVAKHRGLQGIAEEVVTAVNSFNIAEEVLNLAVETVSIAGAKLNAGSEMIAKAIKAGIEFAMYATRLATDRKALNDYYRDTEAGKAVVAKLTRGFDKTGSKTLKDASALNLVDVISDARGYEHTSELVEQTGMTVAQSIVFSASEYNPMMETKLMAIVVMSVMGLDKEIGSTEPAVVEKLFKGFKMSR